MAVPSRPFGARGRAGAAACAQTAGGPGAVLRRERAENRLPTLPERGPWRAERRMGCPHMSSGRGYGHGPALAAIAHKKSDLVHVPPRLVHVRGGVEKSIFFNEFVPPGRIEGITGDPRRVLPPPVPSKRGVPGSAAQFRSRESAIGYRYVPRSCYIKKVMPERLRCRCDLSGSLL